MENTVYSRGYSLYDLLMTLVLFALVLTLSSSMDHTPGGALAVFFLATFFLA